MLLTLWRDASKMSACGAENLVKGEKAGQHSRSGGSWGLA